MSNPMRAPFSIDLGGIPALVPNPGSPARSIASPVSSPGPRSTRLQAAGASLGGLGLGEARTGSPSRDAGSSRFYPRRFARHIHIQRSKAKRLSTERRDGVLQSSAVYPHHCEKLYPSHLVTRQHLSLILEYLHLVTSNKGHYLVLRISPQRAGQEQGLLLLDYRLDLYHQWL